MKISKTTVVSFSTLISHWACAYLALVGFGQPVFGAPLSTPTPSSPPAVPYVRRSRDTSGMSATSAPESMIGQEQFSHGTGSARIFQYPSFKHKHQTRLSRFHGDQPATRTFSIRSMTSFPKLNPLAGMLNMKSGEIRNPAVEEFENEEQDPTFTPFISARALSNIPQFFQHLRSNLEALQFEEDDDDSEETDSGRTMGQSDSGVYGNDDETKVLNIPQPAGGTKQWRPAPAGMTGGRAQIRHLLNPSHLEQELYRKPNPYAMNPARNVYEFGLG